MNHRGELVGDEPSAARFGTEADYAGDGSALILTVAKLLQWQRQIHLERASSERKLCAPRL